MLFRHQMRRWQCYYNRSGDILLVILSSCGVAADIIPRHRNWASGNGRLRRRGRARTASYATSYCQLSSARWNDIQQTRSECECHKNITSAISTRNKHQLPDSPLVPWTLESLVCLSSCDYGLILQSGRRLLLNAEAAEVA